MNEYLFYLSPAVIVSVTGLIFCGLAIRRHPVLGALAVVAGASPWLFQWLLEGRLHLPSAPQWLGPAIGLFSMFGPGVLFGGVMAAVALSNDENKRRKTFLLWVTAVGLVAATLHAMACWHFLSRI
ncbi:MAG: hypothetical protein V4819_18390 [Verrucomicrobiota bacterium]